MTAYMQPVAVCFIFAGIDRSAHRINSFVCLLFTLTAHTHLLVVSAASRFLRLLFSPPAVSSDRRFHRPLFLPLVVPGARCFRRPLFSLPAVSAARCFCCPLFSLPAVSAARCFCCQSFPTLAHPEARPVICICSRSSSFSFISTPLAYPTNLPSAPMTR